MHTSSYANALWRQKKSAPSEARGLIHLRRGGALIALTTALGLILPPASLSSQSHSTIFLWSVAGFYLGTNAIHIHRATDWVQHLLAPSAVGLAMGVTWLQLFGPALTEPHAEPHCSPAPGSRKPCNRRAAQKANFCTSFLRRAGAILSSGPMRRISAS